MLKLIRRKKGGNYYMRGTVAGQEIFESTGCGGRIAAEAVSIKRETEILQRHVYGKAASITLADAALTYMQTGGENRFLAKILQHFGADTMLADIDNAAINEAADAIYPNAAPATVNRQLITPLSAIVTMAADEGLTPPRKFRRRKGDKARTRWLSPEEAERLIAAASGHLAPIIACLLGTGCRTSEALGAEAHFFYPATAEIWLPDTKNDHPRMLRMPQRALDMIMARDVPDVGPIFLTPKGEPYRLRQAGGGQISAAFGNACHAAGLGRDVTPHVLRHTWATWYYAATRDFGGLLDLGGWQKSDMAQRYRKIAPADLAERLLAHGWDFTALDSRPRSTTPKPAPNLRAVKS